MNLTQSIWKLLNSKVFVVVTFISALFILSKTSDDFFNWTKQNTSDTKSYNIYSDGSAYYNYLPQWFIYETGNLEFLKKIESKYPGYKFGDNLSFSEKHNKKINKYYSGTAVAMSPFFLIAHSIESLNGGTADGYSNTYQIFVSIASVFYWLIGAIPIYLLLLNLKIPRFYAVFAIITITFGSNLSHYVIYVPACSHVYSFACVSWILYSAERWVTTNKNHYFYILGFLLGLAFLIRPTNLIILLFIPFFFKNFTAFYSRFKLLLTKNIIVLFIFLILGSLSVFFHYWNTYQQVGEFKLNTYPGEGFDNLLSPYIFEILFGIRKGIFIYAPALLISTFGLIYLYKLRRHLFWGFLIFFCVFTYITASWWCWWYGGGFSMRSFVDIVGIFAIPLAFMLVYMNKVLKSVCILVIFGCIYLTQVYSYQVVNYILHYDNITAKHFSEVFLQTDERFHWHPFLSNDKIPEEYSVIEKSVRFEYYHLPVITVESNSEDNFAGRIKGWYKSVNPDNNPFYRIKYYSNGNTKEKDVYFGSKIPQIGTFEYVTIDMYPEIKKKDLDSISIVLHTIFKEIYVKDVYLDLIKKKK